MAQANVGSVVASVWERATTLASYGMEPLTVSWWKGEAFVRVWDFRCGHMVWRRFPAKDGREPVQPPPTPRRSTPRWLYDALWGF